MTRSKARWWVLAVCLVLALVVGCKSHEERLEPRALTWAELRAVRNPVWVTPPGENERVTLPHERLADGAKIRIEAGGLAWLRRDGGATLLVRGPAKLTLRARSLGVDEGRVFVDTPPGSTHELTTPSGKLNLAAVRASVSVPEHGPAKAYVLSGEVRAEKGRARAGEELSLDAGGAVKVTPVLGWEDWTGGLATTDRAAAPAPFGVGTVGARSPGEQGAPRFPLSIQRMDVRVTIDGDYALTEVDQSFFNPSSTTVEGIYGFRTPERAILQRFGVDRDGVVVWGRVKEKAAAAAQYQANVYQGSTEDPALLEWDGPGVYRARLYPIGPGETRRVVVRYAEWLDRTGEAGKRRLYLYPMAAEGSEESLPHVEELKVTFDLSRAGARDVRVGMAGSRSGDQLVVRAHDFVPRADLSLELLDDGVQEQRAYRAKHRVDQEATPPDQREAALKKAESEADYLLVPVRPRDVRLPAGGLDLVIVIDASAATQPATLSMARAATSALFSHLGEQDRAVVLAGDDGLRPVVPGVDKLTKIEPRGLLAVKDALAGVARGGATDLGAMLTAAARQLEPGRRSAVVYIGDAAPTVGELSLGALRERLAKLPTPVRIFGLGVGDSARMDILAGLAQGAFAERISDGYQAARAALRVLEESERPAWLGTQIDLGPSVERVFPNQVSALVSGETLWVLGRMAQGNEPNRLKTSGAGGQSETPLKVVSFDDRGDLGRRWAGARLSQMLEDGEGRASLVDLGMKSGIITPVTSFYVPTKNEMTPRELSELAAQSERAKRDSGARRDREDVASSSAAVVADNKEGGTGTRAKGEEGSMGALTKSAPVAAQAPPPPRDEAPAAASAAPLELAPEPQSELRPGMAGGGLTSAPRRLSRLDSPAFDGPPSSPAPTSAKVSSPRKPARFHADDQLNDAVGSGGLGLSGGGSGSVAGLAGIGTIGQGFGDAHGRLSANNATLSPKVKMGTPGASNPPGDGASPTLTVNVFIGPLPRKLLMCSKAASSPLEERVGLWRERLSKIGGSPSGAAEIYRSALNACEAPTYRERARLLKLMLDAMPGVSGKVSLYRAMAHDLGAADVLYRGILARIRSPEEVRELHEALGLKTVDPGFLAKLLESTPDGAARAAKLRGLVTTFPDDLALALELLNAYEDAGDESALSDLARRLRERPDADASVRTAVGELYLRSAERAKSDAEKARLQAEGRRAFGEIVEFAPEDPVARRRLGDLLLAHGFYADAARQYETLARLTPDDAKVAILRAAAAEGQGLLEEALKWAEKGGASGAPDGSSGPAVTARALAATHLAWARLAAAQAQRHDELEALSARAARVLSGAQLDAGKPAGIRVSLVWAHPELHPSLWTNALGTPMPAPDGDITLGVAQAIVPDRPDAFVEVRLEPADMARAARLGATAELTVVFDELGKTEKIVRKRVEFKPGGPPSQRFDHRGKEVRGG